MHKTENELEQSVHAVFDSYGRNHVKIRRDKNSHPYAFVQYEVCLSSLQLACFLLIPMQIIQDANAAVSGAHGLILDGRKVRIERAKAER